MEYRLDSVLQIFRMQANEGGLSRSHAVHHEDAGRSRMFFMSMLVQDGVQNDGALLLPADTDRDNALVPP